MSTLASPKPSLQPEALAGRRLVFTGRREVACEPWSVPAPGVGQARLRSICSLMSTGTETICFDRAFEAGTTWDSWVRYPFYPGYALVGEVLDVGADVVDLKPGARVAVRCGHASHQVVQAKDCLPIPRSIPPQEAAWFALAKIASMGARVAGYVIGDSVLVIGAGPIGQMSLRWAKAAGAVRIIVVDQMPKRMELARRGGATATIVGSIADALPEILAANGGRKPRVVIDGTGNSDVFAHALRAVRDFGRLVLLGDTGTPSGQRLTQDLIIRGLTVVGAHDGNEEGEWRTPRIVEHLFDLVQTGRFDLSGLNTHVYAPAQAAEAYHTAMTQRAETMGIVFDWTR